MDNYGEPDDVHQGGGPVRVSASMPARARRVRANLRDGDVESLIAEISEGTPHETERLIRTMLDEARSILARGATLYRREDQLEAKAKGLKRETRQRKARAERRERDLDERARQLEAESEALNVREAQVLPVENLVARETAVDAAEDRNRARAAELNAREKDLQQREALLLHHEKRLDKERRTAVRALDRIRHEAEDPDLGSTLGLTKWKDIERVLQGIANVAGKALTQLK
jgi:hypothetical protein